MLTVQLLHIIIWSAGKTDHFFLLQVASAGYKLWITTFHLGVILEELFLNLSPPHHMLVPQWNIPSRLL
jgi:hypothetical protein